MNNLGVIILKPDAIQENLIEPIIQLINELGLSIVTTKLKQFTPDEIPIICPVETLIERELAAYGLIDNYLSGESLVIVLASDSNIIEKTLELKSKIRESFFAVSKETLDFYRAYSPMMMGLVSAKNRVHCPDNHHEVQSLIETVFNDKEVKNIREHINDNESSSDIQIA